MVARLLREKYGKQVRRSPYPHAATAIGLAIAADTKAGYKLRERFTRHFGVWREWDEGRQIAFDPQLRGVEDLKDASISHSCDHTHIVEEVYSCDHNGIIEVEIKDADNGFSRRYTLRRK